jgi:glycopeptide antibiotics resistance protein
MGLLLDTSLIPFVIVTIALAAALGVVVRARRGWLRGVTVASRVLLAGAAAAVAMITLVSHTTPYAARSMLNLVPFASIRLEFHNVNHAIGAWNILGNIVLFAPVGFLGVLASRWPWWRVVVLSAAASIAIETIQYFIGRSADIDDFILNTLGAILGAAIALPLRHVVLRHAVTTRRP